MSAKLAPTLRGILRKWAIDEAAMGHGSQATLMARLVRDAGVPKIAA